MKVAVNTFFADEDDDAIAAWINSLSGEVLHVSQETFDIGDPLVGKQVRVIVTYEEQKTLLEQA